jgi:hypothetical protein
MVSTVLVTGEVLSRRTGSTRLGNGAGRSDRDLRLGVSECRFTRFHAEADLLRVDEGDIGQADETQHPAQIRLLEVDRFGGPLRIEPTARFDDEDPFAGEQALRPGFRVAERGELPRSLWVTVAPGCTSNKR